MEKRRKKRRPDNMERCCIGNCNGHTDIIYGRFYPLCVKHWEAHCDKKFKYKHFKTLRTYLGLPPVKKPEGYEGFDDDFFAMKMELLINVALNVPVVIEEEYVFWGGSEAAKEPQFVDSCVKWDGKKELGSQVYIEINKNRIILLKAQSSGIKFVSRFKIELAVSDLQDILNDTAREYVGTLILEKFGKSKLWEVNDACAEEIGAAFDDRTYIQERGESQSQELQKQDNGNRSAI